MFYYLEPFVVSMLKILVLSDFGHVCFVPFLVNTLAMCELQGGHVFLPSSAKARTVICKIKFLSSLVSRVVKGNFYLMVEMPQWGTDCPRNVRLSLPLWVCWVGSSTVLKV